MKQLQELFEGFSEIYSPGSVKQIAAKLLRDEFKTNVSTSTITWEHDDHVIELHCIDDKYEVCLYNENGELFTEEGYEGEMIETYDPSGRYVTGHVYSPIQEWDDYEKEQFVKQIFKL